MRTFIHIALCISAASVLLSLYHTTTTVCAQVPSSVQQQQAVWHNGSWSWSPAGGWLWANGAYTWAPSGGWLWTNGWWERASSTASVVSFNSSSSSSSSYSSSTSTSSQSGSNVSAAVVAACGQLCDSGRFLCSGMCPSCIAGFCR